MAQLQLPVFPEGVTQLSCDLGVCCRDGRVSYFYGTLPVFTHGVKDLKSFRMFTSQLYLEGKVKQMDLVRVFGVSQASVKRAVKLHTEAGPGGFWRARPTRGPSVLTPEVLQQAQAQLESAVGAWRRWRRLWGSSTTRCTKPCRRGDCTRDLKKRASR
jgi:hypothetical protein